jgi:hypothetical protein
MKIDKAAADIKKFEKYLDELDELGYVKTKRVALLLANVRLSSALKFLDGYFEF